MYGPDWSSSDDDDEFLDDLYYDSPGLRRSKRQPDIVEELTEEQLQAQKLESVFIAIAYGREQDAIAEIKNGLNINVDLKNGWTPFLLAATTSSNELMELLINMGVDVNQQREGDTALMYACQINTNDSNQIEKICSTIKLLIENGADVNLLDRRRRNALMLAAYNGHLEVVKLLLPLTDRNHEDNQHWNPLFWAVDGNQPSVVKYLLDENFDVFHTDIRGCTVNIIAESNNFTEVLKLLPDTEDDELHLNLNLVRSFDELFQDIDRDGLPSCFIDMYKFLYGCKSEALISIITEKNVSLVELLAMNDSELEEIGIALPYQRWRILEGIYKFHKRSFKRKSVPFFIPKDLTFSNIDISIAILGCIRQTIAMQTSLKFLKKCHVLLPKEDRQDLRKLSKISKNNVCKLKNVVKRFIQEAEKWDQSLMSVDKITKKRLNVPWGYFFLTTTATFLASATFILYKLK